MQRNGFQGRSTSITGKQFIAKEFKEEAKKHGIKLIFGKPYHPRGRGKIERYHSVLWQELITQKRFSSLSHFKRELRKFDHRYNYWRKSQSLGWKTPAEIYNDKKYLARERSKRRIRQWSGPSESGSGVDPPNQAVEWTLRIGELFFLI